jgi:hypothetical protein
MFYAYIMAHGPNGTLCTGSTDDLGKIELIEAMNPTWADLYEGLMSSVGFN